MLFQNSAGARLLLCGDKRTRIQGRISYLTSIHAVEEMDPLEFGRELYETLPKLLLLTSVSASHV
jgi:hypothetical protein